MQWESRASQPVSVALDGLGTEEDRDPPSGGEASLELVLIGVVMAGVHLDQDGHWMIARARPPERQPKKSP
jgi:hypothetical protein